MLSSRSQFLKNSPTITVLIKCQFNQELLFGEFIFLEDIFIYLGGSQNQLIKSEYSYAYKC